MSHRRILSLTPPPHPTILSPPFLHRHRHTHFSNSSKTGWEKNNGGEIRKRKRGGWRRGKGIAGRLGRRRRRPGIRRKRGRTSTRRGEERKRGGVR